MRVLLAVVLAGAAACVAAQSVPKANRAPSAAERKKMAEQVRKMDFSTLCAEAGQVLRKPHTTARGKYWDGLLVARANLPAGDVPFIRERRLSLGLDECSAIAVLGKPDAQVRDGQSNQLVYRERKIYVFTDNGVVRAWQD